MKIEWLNHTRTEAIVTVGWLRKRRAHVYKPGYNSYWRFKVNDAAVPWSVDWRLDRADQRLIAASIRAARDAGWERVEQRALPEARTVRR